MGRAGHTAHHVALADVLGDDRARGDDGVGADGDAREYDGAVPDEDVVADVDLADLVELHAVGAVEHRHRPVVAHQRARREQHVVADADQGGIEDVGAERDADVLTHGVEAAVAAQPLGVLVAVGAAEHAEDAEAATGLHGQRTRSGAEPTTEHGLSLLTSIGMHKARASPQRSARGSQARQKTGCRIFSPHRVVSFRSPCCNIRQVAVSGCNAATSVIGLMLCAACQVDERIAVALPPLGDTPSAILRIDTPTESRAWALTPAEAPVLDPLPAVLTDEATLAVASFELRLEQLGLQPR
jgi:hypothetical protein